MNLISSFQGPQNRAYRARVQYCKKKNLTKWRRRRRKKKEEEESDREDGGSDRRRGTPRSKNFKKEIPRRIRISEEEEEESNDSLISKFQASIRQSQHWSGAWVCWFRCGFVDFVVGLLGFLVSLWVCWFGCFFNVLWCLCSSLFLVLLSEYWNRAFVEWVSKSSL